MNVRSYRRTQPESSRILSDGVVHNAGDHHPTIRGLRPRARFASYYFNGDLDEIAVYPTELTYQQVMWHYHANH